MPTGGSVANGLIQSPDIQKVRTLYPTFHS
jgi:hypothetical protein